jgi:hypothetical protein
MTPCNTTPESLCGHTPLPIAAAHSVNVGSGAAMTAAIWRNVTRLPQRSFERKKRFM